MPPILKNNISTGCASLNESTTVMLGEELKAVAASRVRVAITDSIVINMILIFLAFMVGKIIYF